MTQPRRMTLLDAIADRNLFASKWFRGSSWSSWRTFIAALFALPLRANELALYRQCTGRSEPQNAPAREAWLVCGRRSGKSFMLALVAVFLATFRDYRGCLAPGERATILVIAADRRQARVIFRFIRGLLTGVPMLARLIERETADAFDLRNSMSIEVATASFRSTRGYALAAALCDELAYWPSDDAADPDYEILAAMRPGMATIPGAMLLCASSPHARRGALFDAYKKHFGKDNDPILIWQAPTRVMNPTVPQSIIDEAMAADPAKASAEYLATFRTDVETFVSRDIVEALVIAGRYELPYQAGFHYAGFVDPSGGSADSFTLCIAHLEGERIVVDVLCETPPPFSPDDVSREYCGLLKAYGIFTVYGDNYAKAWPRERFAVHGVTYRTAPKVKNELYQALLPSLNSGRVELIDMPRLVHQLCALERSAGPSGREIISHPPAGHDDVANALAGAVTVALQAVATAVPLVAPYVVNKYGEVLADPAMIVPPATPSPAPTAAKAPSASSKVDTVVNGLPPTNKVPASRGLGNIPPHYLKGGMGGEPWRPYVEGDGLHWASVGRWGHVGTRPWRE
jgi:hypothetical protein